MSNQLKIRIALLVSAVILIAGASILVYSHNEAIRIEKEKWNTPSDFVSSASINDTGRGVAVGQFETEEDIVIFNAGTDYWFRDTTENHRISLPGQDIQPQWDDGFDYFVWLNLNNSILSAYVSDSEGNYEMFANNVTQSSFDREFDEYHYSTETTAGTWEYHSYDFLAKEDTTIISGVEGEGVYFFGWKNPSKIMILVYDQPDDEVSEELTVKFVENNVVKPIAGSEFVMHEGSEPLVFQSGDNEVHHFENGYLIVSPYPGDNNDLRRAWITDLNGENAVEVGGQTQQLEEVMNNG